MHSHPAFIGKFDLNKPTRVYGAGIAGLSCAYFAKKAGFQIEVHEKSDRIGGLIQCEKTDKGFVDSAAHTILVTKELEELFQELHLKPEYFPKKTKRLLCREKTIFQTFPISLKDFPKIIVKGFSQIPNNLLQEQTTVEDFFTPWLGEKITQEIVSTGLSGIYAAYANELHFQSIFPAPQGGDSYIKWARRTIKSMRSTKTKSASFPRGMAALPEAFAKKLLGSIHYNSSPAIDESYNNIICTNAHHAAELIPEQASKLEQILYNSVKKTTVFLDKKIDLLDEAFGVLLSEESSFQSMGIINTSYLFPQRTFSPDEVQYSFIHRNDSDYVHDLKLLKSSPAKLARTFDWPKGIPLYSYERYKAVNELKEEDLGSVILFGNYTGEISLRKMILAAKTFFS